MATTLTTTLVLGALLIALVSAKEQDNDPGDKLSQDLFSAVVAKDLDQVKAILRNNSQNLDFLDGIIKHDGSLASSIAKTALFEASARGHLKIVLELLTTGKADPDVKTNKGFSPLYEATGQALPNIVKLLVEEGNADVNLKNGPDNVTALMKASHEEIEDIVTYLVNQGANVDQVNNQGFSALHFAVKKGNLGIVQTLVSVGEADVNLRAASSGYTVLMEASRQGNLNIVKFLNEKGNADPSLRTTDLGETAVYQAAKEGHLDVVRYLVDSASANVHIRDKAGCGLLYAATKNGHLEVVKFLLEEQDIDVNQKSCHEIESTPLQTAASSGHPELVKYLLDQGAKSEIEYKDLNHRTAFYLAALGSHRNVMKILHEEGGALVDSVNGPDQWTALHATSHLGYMFSTRYLVEEAGASAIARTVKGLGPYHLAEKAGNFLVAKYLESKENCGKNAITQGGDIGLSGPRIKVPNSEGGLLPAERGSWPWLASLGRKMVRIGDGNINETIGIQWRFIKDSLTHPKYDLPYFDVAVITLSSPVNLTNGYTNQICLPNVPSDEVDELDGFQLDVAGYEFGEHGSCRGDSGGPLVRYTHYDSPSSAQYVQHGIVHGGIGACGSKDFPSIYVRIRDPDVLGFINGIIIDTEKRRAEDLSNDMLDAFDAKDLTKVKTILEENKENLDFVKQRLFAENEDGEIFQTTLLHTACAEGLAKIVEALLVDGEADATALTSTRLPSAYYAAANGHRDVLKVLVEHTDMDINAKYGEKGNFLLMDASIRNKGHVVEYLIANGANVNLRNAAGFSALYNATRDRLQRIVRTLVVDGKADSNMRSGADGFTPVMLAANFGDLAILKTLIEDGNGKPNLKDLRQGYSALYLACTKGQPETVQYLVTSTNADPSSRSRRNDTPLGIASLLGFLDIVKVLVEKGGVDVDETFLQGSTPLVGAATFGHLRVMEYLVERGADVDKYSTGNATALCLTAATGQLDPARLLIKKGGADVNLRCNDRGWSTALHVACKGGFYDLVVFLVTEAGADVTARTEAGGKTPLEVARENKHDRIVSFLERR